MASISITINGRDINAEAGQTVLEAAGAAGIEIPTLCHHPALKPIGACRVCLVEIAGQRSLQPACTFPLAARMSIQTESPKVVEARKFVLELIFSERNHFCMTCEMSGDCELQKLGYRYGLDHWMYPTYTQNFPVDASPEDFLLDHNRCVVCRRCIRACSELVANHTLDLRQRGAFTMLSADMDAPLGKSSCIACGNCLDVCPTGALVEKRAAFWARDCSLEKVEGICSQCSLGCGIEVLVRANNIVRIRGLWNAPVNGGVLCRKGRFDSILEQRTRVLFPMQRRRGIHIKADWRSTLQLAADHIGGAVPEHLGVLTTTHATNEALQLLKDLFCRQLKTHQVDLFNGVAPEPKGLRLGTLADLMSSRCIVVTGVDPSVTHPVAFMMIKRAVDRGARLIMIEDQETELAPWAFLSVETGQMQRALTVAQAADSALIIYGGTASVNVLLMLCQLPHAAFVALQPGVNTQAAVSLGLNQSIDFKTLNVCYILAGEELENVEEIVARISPQTFVVAQACYASPLTERADLVLPMAVWSERSGSLTNTAGMVQMATAAKSPAGEAKSDKEILQLLAETLGLPPKLSPDHIPAYGEQSWMGKENPSWPR